jgi:hypothetical protein
MNLTFIARFESASTAMGLNNDAEKCNLFGSYLRGKATTLWINAKYNRVTVDNWRSVKEHLTGADICCITTTRFRQLFSVG